MRRFEDAGATDSTNARTLEELGCRRSFVFNRLVDRGVLVEVSDGRYYIDPARAAAFRARRRIVILVILVMLGIFVVTVVVLLWMR